MPPKKKGPKTGTSGVAKLARARMEEKQKLEEAERLAEEEENRRLEELEKAEAVEKEILLKISTSTLE